MLGSSGVWETLGETVLPNFFSVRRLSLNVLTWIVHFWLCQNIWNFPNIFGFRMLIKKDSYSVFCGSRVLWNPCWKFVHWVHAPVADQEAQTKHSVTHRGALRQPMGPGTRTWGFSSQANVLSMIVEIPKNSFILFLFLFFFHSLSPPPCLQPTGNPVFFPWLIRPFWKSTSWSSQLLGSWLELPYPQLPQVQHLS